MPRSRREAGAKLLLWVWAPAVIAAAMTAFTSAAGYLDAPLGFAPALLVSGVFVAWSLEAVTVSGTAAEAALPRARLPWLALVVLIAIVGVTILRQPQPLDVRSGALTSRFAAGPWWGITVNPDQRWRLEGFAIDLRTQSKPDDALVVFYGPPGYYLYWGGDIAANSYWLANADVSAPLPHTTVGYYRRHRLVPTLVVHVLPTAGMSAAELQAACGGLGYPPTLVRATYAIHRKPAYETTAEVLATLPQV